MSACWSIIKTAKSCPYGKYAENDSDGIRRPYGSERVKLHDAQVSAIEPMVLFFQCIDVFWPAISIYLFTIHISKFEYLFPNY